MNNQGLRVFFSVLIVLAAMAMVWAAAIYISFPVALLLAFGAGTGIGFLRTKSSALNMAECRRIPYQKKFVLFFHWYFILVALLAVVNLVWRTNHRPFNSGLFWLVAAMAMLTDWMLTHKKQGVYIGEKKVYMQEALLRTIDPSYVFYLEEEEDRIRFRYRFSSTTLYRKDFAEEDWSRLQKEIDDWSARNGITAEARS